MATAKKLSTDGSQRGTDESEDKGEMKKKVGGRMVGRRGTERISGGMYCSVGSWKEAAEVEGQLKGFSSWPLQKLQVKSKRFPSKVFDIQVILVFESVDLLVLKPIRATNVSKTFDDNVRSCRSKGL